MSYYTTTKKVPGFTILGPLLMTAGLLLAFDSGMRYALNPEMLLDSTSRVLAIANFVMLAVFSFLLLQTGYLLFKGYIYSRYYAVMVLALCYTGVILRIYLLGVSPDKWKIITSLLLLAFIILYLNQRQFRVRFEYKKGLAGIFIFFFWFITIVTAAYATMWTKSNWKNMPDYHSYSYEETPYNDNFQPFPLQYNIVIPPNFQLSSIDSENGRVSITFHNPDYGYIIMNSTSSLTPVYQRMRILGYKNAKQFADSFFHEKIGLIPLFLRKSLTSLDVKEYSEINVGELSIYMEKSEGDNAVAHIFLDNNLIGEITVLSINQVDTGLYNELFSTIKKYNPSIDSHELYLKGMESLKAEDQEKAKRYFAAASAISLDDAEFRYMLAETLAMTGYVSSAKKQLEECLRINSAHSRAQKLSEALAKLK